MILQTPPARRYALCGFVGMGGFERVMSQQIRRMVYNFPKNDVE